MDMPDLFDTAPALTPEPPPEEPKPAETEKPSEIADTLPPLHVPESNAAALAAIIAAFDRKPLFFHGYRILTAEIYDAIEAAKMMTNK